MLTILVRTVFIYIILLIMMRILGKRQLGQLEATELITALIISEIATLPITDPNVPVAFAIVPMIAITSVEIFISFIMIKLPKIKNLLSSHPSIVINKGVLDQKELCRQRISIEELICSIRNNGYATLDEVYYAIIEENGSVTVIPKSSRRQPTCEELGVSVSESGLMHIIISDGEANLNGLQLIGRDRDWLASQLRSRRLAAKDVFLMLCDDSENITIIKKDKK